MAVDEDSNEITAVPKLLELLGLTGAGGTLDAMHCQKETAQAICAKGADDVLTVKGNQPKLHDPARQCPGDRRRLAAAGPLDSQAGHFSEEGRGFRFR